MRISLSLFLTLVAVGSVSTSAYCDGPGNQKAAQLNTQVKVQMGYLLYLPKDYEKQKSWPLMLFLHGAGERGDDLKLVKKHGPPKLITKGKDFPFIVVSPQCPTASGGLGVSWSQGYRCAIEAVARDG